MIQNIFMGSVTTAKDSPLEALGVNPKAFIIQLVTFIFVFALLKKFAFGPIGKMLTERRKTIDAGVQMGLKMEKQKAQMDEKVIIALRDARLEADKIISNGHEEARDIIREAEKVAGRKTDLMLVDAEARIAEESLQAKRKLEKDLIGLISEATEAIIGEKIDAKKDAQIVDRVIKGLTKK